MTAQGLLPFLRTEGYVLHVGGRIANDNERLAAGIDVLSSLIPGAKGTGAAARGGIQLSKHAAERMVERGISEKMIEVGIANGTKFFDPQNGTINYVLKNGFASGKDLLIGVSPETGKVTTVLRGNNLVRKRFIPK